VFIKFCENLRKSVTEALAMIRQAFREESMNRTWAFEWKKLKFTETKKGDTSEQQSQGHAHHFP
jgi:hypothetical protein